MSPIRNVLSISYFIGLTGRASGRDTSAHLRVCGWIDNLHSSVIIIRSCSNSKGNKGLRENLLRRTTNDHALRFDATHVSRLEIAQDEHEAVLHFLERYYKVLMESMLTGSRDHLERDELYEAGNNGARLLFALLKDQMKVLIDYKTKFRRRTRSISSR